MKKVFILFGFTFFLGYTSIAQNDNSLAVQLSHRIAKKMKDSLDLSAQQRNQIYQINMELSEQKQAARQQNLSVDSLTVRIQRIERKRDLLYLPIIGQEKYQLYLQKKKNLINNN